MLVKEYRELVKMSAKELDFVWKEMSEDALIIGGWAAHILVNDVFKEWKKVDYIGSKDIDLGIRASKLSEITQKLIRIGYTPLNFRFFKIFDRETGRPLSIEESKRYPMYRLFYLYLDLILDSEVSKEVMFFSDPVIKYCLDNELWIEVKDYRVIRPEPLLITKLRILDSRESEKRLKDILDSLFVVCFSEFDYKLFDELAEIFQIRNRNKKLAVKILNSKLLELELLDLRIEKDEIRNLKTVFLSILQK
ncbi:MAG: hypothetical protein DRJ44_05755 [Thermoprotei archaeon]|nr:MAG: hypothetical protein DRJ44_05755 [Thermoprotei archaeon]